MNRSETKLSRDARAIFGAALKAAEAGGAVRRHLAIRGQRVCAGRMQLPTRDFDRIFVVAAGKAAVEMAAAVEQIAGARLSGGVAVTKYGHTTRRLANVRVFEAGHPIPDTAGVAAAYAVLAILRELNARDLLIVAVSGGASALLPAPVEGLTLGAKQKTTELLLRAGASIEELNAIRKHLSLLKGGRLAALAYPATVVGLILSDVVGDRLDVIGSGLTAPDDSTYADALAVLKKFELMSRVPAQARRLLEAGAKGDVAESPKSRDPLFANVHNTIVASNREALKAAAKKANELGYRPVILASTVEGEAREAARVHAAILREVLRAEPGFGNVARRPCCLLSGGETTVTVRGKGKGGRNQEFALAAALAIDGLRDGVILSAGTDGTDGPTNAAGGIASGTTVRRAANKGFDAAEHLRENNSYPLFEALGDLVETGPTGTNVMDVNVMLAG